MSGAAKGAGRIQIKASAGSGKTYALTRCFLEALGQIGLKDPGAMARASSGILAVTFTNPAANEMRERVILKLKEIALNIEPDNLPGLSAARARQWLDVFFHDTSALNIRTIDSLLHQIIRASALDLHIHPDYETSFDVLAAMRPVLDEHLELAREDSAQRKLLLQAFTAMFAGRSGGFGRSKRIIEQIEKLMQCALLGGYDGLEASENYGKLKAELASKACASAGRLLDLASETGLKWQSGKKPQVERYAKGDLQKNRPKVVADGDCALLFAETPPGSVIEAYEDFHSAVDTLHAFLALSGEAAALAPCIAFVKDVAADFLARQRESGVVLQCLVSRYARNVLNSDNGVSEALCRMGSKLHCALIDEFQDTGQDQWAALQPLALDALSRGGSITWVGDIKQSIYGWRGGDSALFEAPCEDAGLQAVAPAIERRTLNINRRSKKEIVEHNNLFFSPLADASLCASVLAAALPTSTTPGIINAEAAQIAAAYKDVAQQVWEKKGTGGYARITVLTSTGTQEIREEGTLRLLELLQNDILKRRPRSDVLVLVRGDKEAKLAVEQLSAKDIPVITENGLLLSKNRLVGEIVSFLRFLNDPEDDVSLWKALQGEIIGGSIEGAVLGNADIWLSDTNSRIRQRLKSRFPDVWDRLIEPFYSQAGLWSVYDIIREFFVRFQIEARFPDDITMLRRFLELAYQLENRGIATLGEFLEFWDEHGDEEKAPLPEQMDAIRIMTIHKAKGLQAPVVILPSTLFPIRAPDLPLASDMGGYLVAAPYKKELGRPYYQNLAGQARESLNLLYVAMTRPQEELYVFHSPNRKDRTKFYLDRAVSKLIELAGFGDSYEYGVRPDPAGAQHSADEEPANKSGEEQKDWRNWYPMKWLPQIRIFRNQINSGQLSAAERGILVHAALERASFEHDIEEAANLALASASSALGMSIPADARQGLLDAIGWYLSLPQARSWREHGLAEHSFLLEDGTLLRPDLIVCSKDSYLVIDFKTGQPQDAHLEQVRNYITCIEASAQFSGKPRGLLVYLDLRRFRLILPEEAGELSEDVPL